MQDKASKRKRRGQKLFALQAKTTFGHRKSDKHERIRNPLLKEKRIAAVALFPRNDKATAYCTHLAAFVTTKRFVILRAKRERIRISLKRKTDCPSRSRGFAMTKAEERIAAHLTAVSPADSVGASASQRCPPDTRTAMIRGRLPRTYRCSQ